MTFPSKRDFTPSKASRTKFDVLNTYINYCNSKTRNETSNEHSVYAHNAAMNEAKNVITDEEWLRQINETNKKIPRVRNDSPHPQAARRSSAILKPQSYGVLKPWVFPTSIPVPTQPQWPLGYLHTRPVNPNQSAEPRLSREMNGKTIFRTGSQTPNKPVRAGFERGATNPVTTGYATRENPVNPRGRVKTFFIEDKTVHLHPCTSGEIVRQQYLKVDLLEGNLFCINIDRTFGLIKSTKDNLRFRFSKNFLILGAI